MRNFGRNRRFLLVAAIAGLTPAMGLAAPSCSVWMNQGNGTSWATCVNDDGSQHCWLINNTAGSTAYEVACG